MPLICIDPGHGGKQPGAANGARLEKDAALAISKQVATHLQEAGFRVIMTRETDVGISLKERCAISNREGADAFISIHLNAARSKEAHGTEVWKWHLTSERTARLAESIQTALVQALNTRDRGVKQTEAYYTLRHTTAPSLVVEVGFISNDVECEMLFTDENQKAAARAIAYGIVNGFEA